MDTSYSWKREYLWILYVLLMLHLRAKVTIKFLPLFDNEFKDHKEMILFIEVMIS